MVAQGGDVPIFAVLVAVHFHLVFMVPFYRVASLPRPSPQRYWPHANAVPGCDMERTLNGHGTDGLLMLRPTPCTTLFFAWARRAQPALLLTVHFARQTLNAHLHQAKTIMATTNAPARPRRLGPQLYFDRAQMATRKRYDWAGKFQPGHCFLCDACMSCVPHAQYPCPTTAKGRDCTIAGEPTNHNRVFIVRITLATLGDACRTVLEHAPWWRAVERYVRRKLGEVTGFAITVCRRDCIDAWRQAEAEDEAGAVTAEPSYARNPPSSSSSSSSSKDTTSVPAESTATLALLPPPQPPSPPQYPPATADGVDDEAALAHALTPNQRALLPGRHRRRDSDLNDAPASPSKRPRLAAPPSPPAPVDAKAAAAPAASSPLMALVMGHMHLQAAMVHLNMMRARLDTRERLHAMGYSREEIDLELNGAGTLPSGAAMVPPMAAAGASAEGKEAVGDATEK
ncbi:hypothetical protein AMAG_15398 [Allomyces macrogynus ATCC 38327]|uniref:Uncharacterized protein n=1 Tax=Allomyces macrogynus (strain ATCC 38327) TaxID=578462 RepID=A0A0L0T7C0_ALLM3|nr:hypothetical protein AMAG_15398 [Allomyces macrogynus ATCC 38327]|eukprot:KNE70642.1 hypothetical protein AMAG_15398 [Allomyces macrogynus ATCC 38327]